MENGLDSLIKGLNIVLNDTDIKKTNVKIAIETMSGKGTEICTNFEQIRYVLDRVEEQNKVGVCIDTCHINDAGYDIKNDLDGVIGNFNEIIGLNKLFVIHLNDSKNSINSHKDRHHNIGYGTIGFKVLNKIVHNPLFKDVPIILETPWIGNYCPYKEEIKMLKNSCFSDPFKELLNQ
nr:deoxyribonuclease IV [Spiroplasma litorale]